MDQNVNDNQVEKAVAFRDPRRNEANSSKDFQTIATGTPVGDAVPNIIGR